jgi:hypothetical protein
MMRDSKERKCSRRYSEKQNSTGLGFETVTLSGSHTARASRAPLLMPGVRLRSVAVVEEIRSSLPAQC